MLPGIQDRLSQMTFLWGAVSGRAFGLANAPFKLHQVPCVLHAGRMYYLC